MPFCKEPSMFHESQAHCSSGSSTKISPLPALRLSHPANRTARKLRCVHVVSQTSHYAVNKYMRWHKGSQVHTLALKFYQNNLVRDCFSAFIATFTPPSPSISLGLEHFEPVLKFNTPYTLFHHPSHLSYSPTLSPSSSCCFLLWPGRLAGQTCSECAPVMG